MLYGSKSIWLIAALLVVKEAVACTVLVADLYICSLSLSFVVENETMMKPSIMMFCKNEAKNNSDQQFQQFLSQFTS